MCISTQQTPKSQPDFSAVTHLLAVDKGAAGTQFNGFVCCFVPRDKNTLWECTAVLEDESKHNNRTKAGRKYFRAGAAFFVRSVVAVEMYWTLVKNDKREKVWQELRVVPLDRDDWRHIPQGSDFHPSAGIPPWAARDNGALG